MSRHCISAIAPPALNHCNSASKMAPGVTNDTELPNRARQQAASQCEKSKVKGIAASPAASYRISNSSPFECDPQKVKGIRERYHGMQYALRASSAPNLVTAIRKVISASLTAGCIWRIALRWSESAAFQRTVPMLRRSEGVISASRRK